ncbi:hypothetical protein C4901_01230 [Acidiferrobacter sp. SPIII_3]|nr:hypothetical protein C4901_01230 [Acidiferrobacter sp. SPIII_3]
MVAPLRLRGLKNKMNWAYTIGYGQALPPDSIIRSYGDPAPLWWPSEPLSLPASWAQRNHSISSLLDRESGTTTLVIIELDLYLGDARQHPPVDRDAENRLRTFRDWLASIPPVPHIPLDKLSRDELY